MTKSSLGSVIIALIVIIIAIALLYPYAVWGAHHQKCNGLLIDNSKALREMQHDPTESNIAHQKQTWDNYMKECSSK